MYNLHCHPWSKLLHTNLKMTTFLKDEKKSVATKFLSWIRFLQNFTDKKIGGVKNDFEPEIFSREFWTWIQKSESEQKTDNPIVFSKVFGIKF